MKTLLLVNPHSRSGQRNLRQARELLVQHGMQEVEAPGDGSFTELIRRHGADVDRVIVGGGDGTLNAALPGIMEADIPVGVLPLGTANDFARTLGIPLELPHAIAVIAAGKHTRVDIGQANGHPFLNVASIGFSAELAKLLTARAKKYWGKLGYGIVAARLLKQSRVFKANLHHDGVVEELRTLQISVGNGRHYGGGMTVHHDATATDGLLDFYSLEIDHWWRLLKLLPSLRKGTHGQWDDVRAFSTKRLAIHTTKALPVNLDGELKTTTPVDFSIREKAISVYAP